MSEVAIRGSAFGGGYTAAAEKMNCSLPANALLQPVPADGFCLRVERATDESKVIRISRESRSVWKSRHARAAAGVYVPVSCLLFYRKTRLPGSQ